MENISVIIHEVPSSKLFWEALVHALRKESRFNVAVLEKITEIVQVFEKHNADIFICGTELDVAASKLLQCFPSLIIVQIDEEDAKTVVRSSQSVHVNTRLQIDDPDCSGFIDLVKQFFPVSVGRYHPDLKLLKTQVNVETNSNQETVNIRKPRIFCEDRESKFQDSAKLWVESIIIERLGTLLQYESGETRRTVSWGLATRDACYLLGVNPDSIQVDTLRSERFELEKSIFWKNGDDVVIRFHWLAKAFNLDVIQQQLLLLSIAPELDGRISQVYGCLNDDMTRRWATQSLLKELPTITDKSDQELIQEIFGDSRLTFFGLLARDESYALPMCDLALKVTEDVRCFLTSGELNGYNSAFRYFPAEPTEKPGRSTKVLRTRLAHWIDECESNDTISVLSLDACLDDQRWFVRGATEMGIGVVKVDARALQERNSWDVRNRLLSATRIAILADSIVFLTGLASITKEFRKTIESITLDLLTSRVPLLAIEGRFTDVSGVSTISRLNRKSLSVTDRADVWLDYADRLNIDLTPSQARELGSWVRFNEADIEQTLFFCRDKLIDVQHFNKVARHVSSTNIPGSVRCLPAQFTWDDIVLPVPVMEVLRRIPNHITHREKVLTEWGYRERMSYGLGTACLFSGASGTGKTMASQIIASAIGESEIFQCDLAKTVSKYIGETEKNLDAIFDAAEKARAVLVFNEADVLFGKRTEIRDAHDRYANLEVGYLLQRMESYEGLVILTTNSRASMDIAFLRRLRFIVEFPVPPASDREKIWHRVFPDKLKRADDVTFSYLAQQLDLNGGHIQQIAILAAYAAAAEGCEKLHMRHVISATREELTKIGMDSAQQILDEVAA